MAAQDLQWDPFASQRDPYCVQQEESPGIGNQAIDVNRGSSPDIPEEDVVDSQGVTAICTCQEDQRGSLLPSELNNVRLATTGDLVNSGITSEKILSKRSISPLSQDFRSQDSGFSDSDRSNCSGANENRTPRRRSRRKRVKERRHGDARQPTDIWLQGVSNPPYTSTPKNYRTWLPRGSRKSPERGPSCKIDKKEETAVHASAISSLSLGDECLGDFLYVIEPPEDTTSVDSRSVPRSKSSNFAESSVSTSTSNSGNHWPPPSVRAWLNDLESETSCECGTALQNKSLPRRRPNTAQKGQVRETLSSLAITAVSQLLIRAEQFDQHYQYACEKLSNREENGMERTRVIRVVEDDAFSLLTELGAPPPHRIRENSSIDVPTQLELMKSRLDEAVNARLDFYIKEVVRELEESPRPDATAARGALAALTALGLAGPRAGSSVARCSGIRALLTSLITVGRTSSDFVAACLRALASVCCCTQAIEQFAEDGGPEIVTDLLRAANATEREKAEATGLIVQITAPWTRAVGLPHLEPFADLLVPSLNDLVECSNCGQTLLLAAAALNNLSKSKRCVNVIIEQDTVSKLLGSVKKSAGKNVWLMEQVVALIGELARIPKARTYLAKVRASVALVSFLRMRPPGLEDPYKRLEITAAAALTRLCLNPEIARQVVAVGGEDCLPSCRIDEFIDDDERIQAGLLKYTKSLRRACKKAAKHITIAKTHDSSPIS